MSRSSFEHAGKRLGPQPPLGDCGPTSFWERTIRAALERTPPACPAVYPSPTRRSPPIAENPAAAIARPIQCSSANASCDASTAKTLVASGSLPTSLSPPAVPRKNKLLRLAHCSDPALQSHTCQQKTTPTAQTDPRVHRRSP